MTEWNSGGPPPPLIEAVWGCDIGRVAEMLRNGADPNVMYTEVSALGWAVQVASAEIVNLLLGAGADPDRGGRTPLMKAAFAGDPKMVSLLVRAGADANVRDGEGGTALMNAAKAGHVEIVDTLLRNGARADDTDEELRTALTWSATRGDFPETVARLLAAGANPNGHGRTPLSGAALMGGLRTAHLLLNAGADVGMRDVHTAMTPLMFASIGGSIDMIQLLLARGAHLDDRDRYGGTPLMYAAREGHAAAARILLEGGADPALRNANGLSARQIAEGGNHADLAGVLRRAEGRGATGQYE